MLSVFPTMYLSLLAFAILRVFVGGIFLYLGLRHLRRDRRALLEIMRFHWPRVGDFFAAGVPLIEIAIGALFVVGFLTQIAAILGGLVALKMLYLRKRLTPPIFPQPMMYVLLLGACASLFITGAGAFAIDLPI